MEKEVQKTKFISLLWDPYNLVIMLYIFFLRDKFNLLVTMMSIKIKYQRNQKCVNGRLRSES